MPIAAAHRAHGEDQGLRHDRRQYRRWPRRGLRRCHRRTVVPDHAVDVIDGRVQELLRKVAGRSGDRQEQLCGDPGRGRARCDRHGARRKLERRARVHGHEWSRHLADVRIHRPRLLRRDPRSDLRRAARRPVDRHADSNPAVRPPDVRLCVARRHEARAVVPVEPGRVLLHVGAGVRSRRAAADPGVRDVRPRHRHERLDVPRTQVGRQLSAGPRQGLVEGRNRGAAEIPSLPGQGRRWHPVSHAAGRLAEGRLFHPRLGPQPVRRVYRGFGRVPGRARPAAAQIQAGQDAGAATGHRSDRHERHRARGRRQLPRRRQRGARHPGQARHSGRLHAHQGVSVHEGSRSIHGVPRHDLRRGAEPRRAAALAADARNGRAEVEASFDPALQRLADDLEGDRRSRGRRDWRYPPASEARPGLRFKQNVVHQ